MATTTITENSNKQTANDVQTVEPFKVPILSVESTDGGEAYLNFISSIKSPATVRTYNYAVRNFMQYLKTKDVDSLLTVGDYIAIQQKVVGFIHEQQKMKLTSQVILMRLIAIKHFYTMNDIVLNWKKINKFVREETIAHEDRPYRIEEIRSISTGAICVNVLS